MQVIWHGHSAVSLINNDLNILIDPFFADGKIPEPARQPDILLLTHDHGDHLGSAEEIMRGSRAMLGCITNLARWLKQNWRLDDDRVLNGGGWNIGGTFPWPGVNIFMTQALHSCQHGMPVGYVLSFADGKNIYHFGDTGLFGDMVILGEDFSLDLAILPIGDIFTMGPEQAAKACALLRPKAVMPAHYGTFPVLTKNTDGFVEALAQYAPATKPLLAVPGARLEL